jgi:hypothetical protein
VSEHISLFVSTAEAAVRDIAPEQVSVASISEVTREAFVAGVSGTQAVREHIKVRGCRVLHSPYCPAVAT